MEFLHSHLDETYLGLGEDPQTSASAAEDVAAPAPESFPMVPLQDSAVILGLTKRQLLAIGVVAAVVFWYLKRKRK